jgi:guanine nucleotide-binding protein G(i) subunit alpha
LNLIPVAKSIIKVAENDQSLLLNAVEVYTIEIHNKVKSLWGDSCIQDAFRDHRYEFHVFDGAQYFFANFDRLAPPKYLPTADDILHCRRKTIGLVSSHFVFEGVKFQIFDVGGQRNERKKWEKSFQGVSAVLYVASLSEYDQKCYEDDITNRMLESLELFDTTINNNFFKDKTIILFLNKLDVFKIKVKDKDLKITFSDYEGGYDEKAGIEFIKAKYAAANRGNSGRLHMHLTCATQKSDVELVMNDVKKFLASEIGKTL